MGSCPIKWLVNMTDNNGPVEAAEHLLTDFELHEQQEFEAITIDSVDGVLICVGKSISKII
jgi:hypothetical protein